MLRHYVVISSPSIILTLNVKFEQDAMHKALLTKQETGQFELS